METLIMWMWRFSLVMVVVVAGCTTDGGADTTGTASSADSTTSAPAPLTSTTVAPTTSATTVTSTSTSTTTLPEPPTLEIADPASGATVTDRVYAFRGLTDPGCTVDVGGKYFADVASNGAWTLRLTLRPGVNSTTLLATQPATGQQTSQAVRVYYAESSGLSGKVLRTVWEELGRLQQYYVESEPTGYYTGSRLPLTWSGDYVALRVGLSTRDASIPNRTYDIDFDGLITLLEPSGRDQYLVLDEQPVMIAADSGILAAMCPVEDIPHIVTLGFTDHGLAPVQAWRIDLEALRLVEVPVDTLPCPDLSPRPVGDDGVGAIVTHLGCDPDTGCDHRYMSLSASGIEPTGFWSVGGVVLPSDANYSAHAVSRTVDEYPVDPAGTSRSWLWLKEKIGHDWSGKPIWRVIDATPATESPISDNCFLSSGEGRAFAEIESWEDPIPRRAWTVDADYSHFQEISTDLVRCEREEGD